ncbi:MAG TPA: type II toxin-antitoxin system HicA family toxin [Thermoanaerobaculia bacterium]|nr:type II toxin-antitoxin system HicA family toxin [Thermoanaerobaculia bacterium]
MAVEVDDVERLPLIPLLQGLLERGVGGRLEDGEPGEAAEALDRVGQRPGADAVIYIRNAVALRVPLRPGADEEDADGQCGQALGLALAVGQAPADAHGVLALEEPAAAVVEELPGERQQFGGSFPSGGLGLLGRAFGQIAVHLDGEAALGAVGGLLPGGESLPRFFISQSGLEQIVAPGGKLLLDAGRPSLEDADRPDVILLQIPLEVGRLDGAEWCDEEEPPAHNVPCAVPGRLVSERGRRPGPAFPLRDLDRGIGQREDELLDRLGVGCLRRLRGHPASYSLICSCRGEHRPRLRYIFFGILQPVHGREVIKKLQAAGWKEVRITGSHHILQKDGKSVPVPVHKGRDLGIGLIRKIEKQTGVRLT